jgi:dienelactone hydrolase
MTGVSPRDYYRGYYRCTVMAPHRHRLTLLAVALALAAVGCGGGGGSTNASRATGSSGQTGRALGTPPSLAAACGSDYAAKIRARPLWLTTSDGVGLYAIEAGDAAVAVVLAHQGGGNLCEELPYAETLLASGLRVLAFDFRGYGRSEKPSRNLLALRQDLAAATERVREDGAERVFLIGASMGGAAVVQNSAGLPVDGIISLSGTRLWAGYGINEPGVRKLRAPFLYIGSRSDSRAPLEEARGIFGRAGSKDKRSVFYPGSLHGWSLVEGPPFGAKTRALILSWIQART